RLTEAVAGFGCAGPASAADLAAFWTTRAMIWSFLDDERADLAFAAARAADASVWNPDFGGQARERWEAASVPEGTGTLVVRDGAPEDQTSLDGKPWRDEPVTAGLHLLQVGDGEHARFARLIQVEAGDTVEVAVGAGTDAPTTRLATAVPFGDIHPPVTRAGARYTDAAGASLSWRLQVQPLASTDPEGRAALRLYRANATLQVATVAAGVVAAYGTYLVGWDAVTGHNLDAPVAIGLTAVGAGLTIGSGALEIGLASRRRALRSDIETGANRALVGNP
ncbi:MAG: hypothetical protein KC621_08945, partial [Myxococcales bacterium]|nr:hypothetical protein [Myxococcales bacterium]